MDWLRYANQGAIRAPATLAAKRRMILQRYGMRATQVVNLLDEIRAEEIGEDETVRAVLAP